MLGTVRESFGALVGVPGIASRARRKIVCALLIALPVAAQPAPAAASSATDFDIIPELVVVSPDGGPAWWKVTKGDSTVFILGLPPFTPRDLQWDKRTLQRRLKGARLVLAPTQEVVNFQSQVGPPRLAPPPTPRVDPRSQSEREPPPPPRSPGGAARPAGVGRSRAAVLPPELANRVVAAANSLGGGMRPTEIVRADDVLHLRGRFNTFHKLTTRAQDEIYDEAKRARVPVVTAAVYQHIAAPNAGSLDYAEAAGCYDKILAEVEGPLAPYLDAAQAWAVGNVEKVESWPPGYYYACRNFWPGYWERTIGFQVNAIAQSLNKPGKVIALAQITLLVAKNGILERLRAQGFEISDPAKPLTE